MTHCARCDKELKNGEDYNLVRTQAWKTKVGSTECKQPDTDDTRTYCVPCFERVWPQ